MSQATSYLKDSHLNSHWSCLPRLQYFLFFKIALIALIQIKAMLYSSTAQPHPMRKQHRHKEQFLCGSHKMPKKHQRVFVDNVQLVSKDCPVMLYGHWNHYCQCMFMKFRCTLCTVPRTNQNWISCSGILTICSMIESKLPKLNSKAYKRL